MLFSSVSFLFVFLPILFLILLFTNKKYHNFILLIASILFYALGEPKFLLIMFSVIFISYLGALFINKFSKYKKIFLWISIIGNLSFLIYFKYFNFIINIVNNITNSKLAFVDVILPLGISFYTFQAISYVIDVYREDVKVQKNLYKFALYICLFPQLIAGPIIKYHDIETAINSREITFDNVTIGVKRFVIGLAKKMLIANVLGELSTSIFGQSPFLFSHSIAWLGVISYGFQIYFDFSGYSDMAIGLGLILGFKFMENFNYPYISKSVTEFWRRWHISLSTWFKYYVYIPLGGNKVGKIKTIRNIGIVFFLTGLWHGANWTFIIWGLWHGTFVIIEKIVNINAIDINSVTFWKKAFCIFIACL